MEAQSPLFYNLTNRASILGGTQLLRGTFDSCNTRFCHKSGKCRNYGFFVVVKSSNVPPENVKTRLKESNVPPLNNDFESNVPRLFILDSRFVAIRALSRFALCRDSRC